jgi:hypothetical protein
MRQTYLACKLHLAMALIGILKWHSVYGNLGLPRERIYECPKRMGKKTFLFLPLRLPLI